MTPEAYLNWRDDDCGRARLLVTIGHMQDRLKRFSPFAHLDRQTLISVSRYVRVLELPAGRWLIRPGRMLSGSLYLEEGKVRTESPARKISAGDVLAREALNPGHEAICSITPVRILQVDKPSIAFLFERSGPEEELPCIEDDDDSWQRRFLRSHMMSALPMTHWQNIMRELEPVAYAAGDTVIEAGGIGDCCFILAAGRALVHNVNMDRVLRHLGPGDFFGEDALVSRLPRNAQVTMQTNGRVMRLPQMAFRRWLENILVFGGLDGCESIDAGGERGVLFGARLESLTVDGPERLREDLQHLDACTSYRVVSRDQGIQALAVFLLRQRGIRAWPGVE